MKHSKLFITNSSKHFSQGKVSDFSHFDAFFCLSLLTDSTINPILYNVMSHRYRVAFRDTLCSRKRGYYSSANGFVRDQSSFRETTIAAASRDHNLNYEGSKLVSIEDMQPLNLQDLLPPLDSNEVIFIILVSPMFFSIQGRKNEQ